MPAWTAIYTSAFHPLASLLVLVAWRSGGTVELKVSLAYVLATDIQRMVHSRFFYFEPVIAIVDWSLFGIVLLYALRERRAWLMTSAGLLLVGAMSHVASALGVKLSNLAYAILLGTSGYPALLLLTIGIATHWRRTRRETKLLSIYSSGKRRSPTPSPRRDR